MLNITKGTLSYIFKVIKNAISEVKSNDVGFYGNLNALNLAYPSPTIGMVAYVDSGDHLTYKIYRCQAVGKWTSTTDTITLSSSLLGDLDYSPTLNSEKLVTSGGVYDADTQARKRASSIVPFAGFINEGSATTMSVNASDDGSNVYYNEGDDTFVLKYNNTYVNNWLNRDDWADSSNHGYPNKAYNNLSNGAVYKWTNNDMIELVVPAIKNISRSEYIALTTKDENTYYYITEE